MLENPILKLRQKLNISQNDLALYLGLNSRLGVWRWENDERKPLEMNYSTASLLEAAEWIKSNH